MIKTVDQKTYKCISQSKLFSSCLEASLGPWTEGVPTNDQRGREPEPCLLCGGCDKTQAQNLYSLLDYQMDILYKEKMEEM